jgi:hypothetical protein
LLRRRRAQRFPGKLDRSRWCLQLDGKSSADQRREVVLDESLGNAVRRDSVIGKRNHDRKAGTGVSLQPELFAELLCLRQILDRGHKIVAVNDAKPPVGRVSPRSPCPFGCAVAERCSAARVRYAAAHTAAPLPPVRRSARGLITTDGSAGNQMQRSFFVLRLPQSYRRPARSAGGAIPARLRRSRVRRAGGRRRRADD